MSRNRGFLLIEVMLAVGILGGAVLCCLGVFTPILSKVRDIEFMEEFEDVERRINAFIQMRSFKEIYIASQEEDVFYFYKGRDGEREVSKSFSEIKGRSGVIRAQVCASSMKNTCGYGSEDYPESYFGIWVEIGKLVDGSCDRVEGKVRTYTVVKNR